MWLRDALPGDLVGEQTSQPMARVMIYGYASAVAGSTSFQNLHDLAKKFRTALSRIVSKQEPIRPMLIIAHSLGGLILKEVT